MPQDETVAGLSAGMVLFPDLTQLDLTGQYEAFSRLPNTTVSPIGLVKAISHPDAAAVKRAFDAMMQMRKIDIAAIEAARRG